MERIRGGALTTVEEGQNQKAGSLATYVSSVPGNLGCLSCRAVFTLRVCTSRRRLVR